MADKKPVAGVVEEVSVNGKTQMRIAGKWYVLSPKANQGVGTPPVGASVSFDAYGRDFDIYYRWNLGVEHPQGYATSQTLATPSGATTAYLPGSVEPAHAPSGPTASIIAVGSRRAALQAAATLLAGSDGTISELCERVTLVADHFDMYLKEQA